MAQDNTRNLSKYFAAKDADETADYILTKASQQYSFLQSSAYLTKLKRSWLYYHGAYYSDVSSGHGITFNGEVGELAQVAVNHYRNIASHMINTITANRPALESRAVNTDYKSQAQTILANGLLDYYMREKKLEVFLKTCVEYSVVLGTGYVKMDWNSTSGQQVDYDEELDTPIYEGDVQFSNLSPFDVVFDTTKDHYAYQEWVLCRTFKNKYDLMAKFPELADKIDVLPSREQLYKYSAMMSTDETDDIPVYEFYHKRTEALPKGRYLMFVSSECILNDGPLPYDDLPIYRLSPSDILGTSLGYSPMFDLMPIQEAINSLYTTIMSNQTAFGVQNVLVPRGADIVPNQLGGGLNVIEYNDQAGVPTSLNLTNTPAEIFNFLGMLEKVAETISGVNSIQRGNAPSDKMSGTAMALIQAQSLQFLSGLQQSYVMMCEAVGTGLINMLKRFASTKRVAAIVGKSNVAELREFNSDDLSNINRVVVDMANPISKTTAGKISIADNLLQYQLLQNPQQYLQLLSTGNLDVITEDQTSELLLIKSENERLAVGEYVVAVATDKHSKHISQHTAVLSNPELRRNPEFLKRVQDHIQEHLDMLKNVDPALLAIIGEQSLAPPPGQVPTDPAMQDQAALMTQAPQGPQDVQNINQPNMPSMPTPPAPFEQMPVNPTALPQ
jgi:hypothetical protein